MEVMYKHSHNGLKPRSFLEVLHKQRKQQSATQLPALRTFLSGPDKCGKTSIALDLAHSIANDGVKVVFVRHASQKEAHERSKFVSLPVKLHEREEMGGKEWDKEALLNISIQYPTDFSDLVQLLASVQLFNTQDSIVGGIIIDDLHLFLTSTSFEIMMIQLLGLTLDAVHCLDSIQANSGNSVKVLVTMNTSAIEPVPKLVMNYLPTVTNIQLKTDDNENDKKIVSKQRVELTVHEEEVVAQIKGSCLISYAEDVNGLTFKEFINLRYAPWFVANQ